MLFPLCGVVCCGVVWSVVLQDHLLPYMLQGSHPPDTVFFVAEEDWRLHHSDTLVTPETVAQADVRKAGGSVAAEQQDSQHHEKSAGTGKVSLKKVHAYQTGEPSAPSSGGPSAPSTGEPSAPGSGDSAGVQAHDTEWAHKFGAFHERPHKPQEKKGEEVQPSQEIKDLVRLVTLAHRHDLGDLVWLSWDGANSRGHKCKPGHACTLLAVTIPGARKLQGLMLSGKIKKGHFDLSLLSWLREDPQNVKELKASYFYPSVGSYTEHISGCQKGLGLRPTSFGKDWVQAGTRKSTGGPKAQDRWLMRFMPKGLDWIVQVDPEKQSTELRWLTYKPEEGDPAVAKWQEARQRTRGGQPPKVPLVSPAVVLKPEDRDYSFFDSKRQRRQYRQSLVGMTHRNYVENDAEAVRVCMFVDRLPMEMVSLPPHNHK